jgi:hypothetical protein
MTRKRKHSPPEYFTQGEAVRRDHGPVLLYAPAIIINYHQTWIRWKE